MRNSLYIILGVLSFFAVSTASAGTMFPPVGSTGTGAAAACPANTTLVWSATDGGQIACVATSSVIDGISCSGGQVMTGIANGRAVCRSILSSFASMYVVNSDYTAGSGTKTASCRGGDVRVGCGYYSNPQDGLSMITTYASLPYGSNGCTFSTTEGVDAWAVTAYCVPE